MTNPRDREAMEKARATAPCCGDGIAGPKDCDESFDCALHERIARALLEFAEEESIERRRFEGEWQVMCKLYRTAMETNEKQAKSHMELRKEIEILKSANEFISKAVDFNRQKAHASGYAEALEKAAKIANDGHVVMGPLIAEEIRALLPTGVKDV